MVSGTPAPTTKAKMQRGFLVTSGLLEVWVARNERRLIHTWVRCGRNNLQQMTQKQVVSLFAPEGLGADPTVGSGEARLNCLTDGSGIDTCLVSRPSCGTVGYE
jgi:hypothetical protein